MAYYNGRQYTDFKGLNLKADNGVIRFATPLFAPTTTSGERLLYVNSSNELIYNNGTGTVVLGAAGGAGSTPSWETLFAADATMTITPDSTFTIAGNRSTATNVVTMTNIAGGSGAILQLTNSTTSNKDINGTSSTWSVLGTGVGTFAGLSVSGTSTALATTGAAVWTILDNSATSLRIGPSGGPVFLTFDTRDGAEVLSTDALTFQVTAGKTNLIQASNTISALVVTDNTVTTFGADANSSGVAVIRSTSLTTGALLQLQLTEGTLNGGFYIVGRDVTAGANVYTVGEDGATVIAGAGGSNMLTVTAGDVVISDGSIALTDADNAASFSVTNSTATTASVVVIAGAGTFTGSTTTSFATLTPSGLTTGTALYIAAAALTTGKVVDITATAATDGVLVNVTGGGANMTATGGMATLAMGAATVGAGLRVSTTGVYTGAGLIQLTANSATTGVIQQITANGLTTGTALDLSSTGTITTTGEMLNVAANSATTSTGLVRVSGTALTDGWAMLLTGGGANATASGGVADLVGGAATVGSVLRVTTTGVYSGTTGVVDINAASATTGVIVDIGAAGLTEGTAIKVTATEATLTTGKYVEFYDGAANDFSVAKYGATVIAGNAQGTAALTVTAGDLVLTAGNATVGGKFILSGTETIDAGGTSTALALTKSVHYVDADAGGDTFTLADGVAGQVMTILMKSSTGTATITPTNLAGGTSVTFNAAGDSVVLQFMDTDWYVIGGNSYAVV